MNRFRRIGAVAFSVAALVLTSGTAVATAAMDGDTVTVVQGEIQGLPPLAAGTQDSHTVAVTDDPVTDEITIDRKVTSDADAGVQGCWIAWIQLNTRSVGILQHQWKHEFHWCDNGSSVLGVHVNDGYNVYSGTNWAWKGDQGGRITWVSGGAHADRQGWYQLSYPWLTQNNYPYHKAFVKAGGAWSTVELRYR